MSFVIQLKNLIHGLPTKFDNQWLVEYDPSRDGVDPDGNPMLAHVVTSSDLNKAKLYPDSAEAIKEWQRVDERAPVRPDGKPNRPLTAFTVVIQSLAAAQKPSKMTQS